MKKLTNTPSMRLMTGCLSMLAVLPLSAQETETTPLNGDFDFLSVKDVKLQTTGILQDDALVYWNEDGLHAGIQGLSLTIFNNREIPKDFDIPENPTYYFSISDMNAETVASQDQDIAQLFRMMKYSKNFSSTLSSTVMVKRGGEYQVKAALAPNLYTYEKNIVLKEEAAAQIYNTSMLADSLLVPSVYITSGYPYDANEVSGEKYLRWILVAAASPSETIAEKEEKFELYSELPTLAAIAEINIEIPELQPGEYLLTLVSDYEPANRSVKLYVKDVLDVDITFDKEECKLGIDKELTMHFDMRYGYPYIMVDKETNKPTVTVTVDLLGEKTTETYSDEAWEISEMNCSGNIKISLDKIDKEQIEEYKGEIPMTVTVSFNDATQYYTSINIPFVTDDSGIGNLMEDETSQRSQRMYNAFGVEVDATYQGLVITSDGKKFIKK